MKNKFLHYIDFEKVNNLLEGFSKSTGFVTAIIDLEGNVLSKSGWRQICTEFHHINPETAGKCKLSDTVHSNKMSKGEKYHFYECLNGLVNVAVPIIIKGKHIANLFSGQFFFKKPDIAFFKKQAEQHGFDEESYLKALHKVPVVSREHVTTTMEFLRDMTRLVSEMTSQKLEQTKLNNSLKAAKEKTEASKRVISDREKDMQFRKLSANVPDLIFQFTRRPDGTYFVPVASEGIRNIFGCTPEDVKDDFAPIARVIYAEDAERVISEIEYSADHLTYFTCEFRVQIPGRPIQWIYSRSSPEKLPDGSITWYGFNADITFRKEADEAIRQLNSELEQRVNDRTSQLEAVNKELEAFSYSVSHDLRAPLRHINGFAEILGRKYSDKFTDEGHKYLNTIIDSAHKMGTLIDDLLSFSRTGRSDMKKSPLKMEQVVKDALTQIEPLIQNRKIIWKISTMPEVYGDFNLLKLVWINLIDNAVKFTRNAETAEISIGFKELNNELTFYIRDNGVGYDMKYAKKLFGVFQRLHTAAEFDGTGIGLANVQRIVLRHGGKVWAESEPGKGAAFYFSIPKSKFKK